MEHEPAWLPEDLTALLAWQRWDDGACTGCGQQKAESMRPGNDNAFDAEPLQCHSCRAARRAVDGWKSDELHGIYVVTRRRDDDGV